MTRFVEVRPRIPQGEIDYLDAKFLMYEDDFNSFS